MNFRQRLINVLTAMLVVFCVLCSFAYSVDHLTPEKYLTLIAGLAVFVLSKLVCISLFSYLMGVGFKPWHSIK